MITNKTIKSLNLKKWKQFYNKHSNNIEKAIVYYEGCDSVLENPNKSILFFKKRKFKKNYLCKVVVFFNNKTTEQKLK